MKNRVRLNREPWWRRGLGYLTRLIHNLVTGFDTVFTLVKVPLIFGFGVSILKKYHRFLSPKTNSDLYATCNKLLRVALKPWATRVIGISALGSLFYMVSALKDEYDKNIEEDLKLQELKRVEEEEEKITAHIQEKFPPNLFDTPSLHKLDNGGLLKLYLRNYLLQLDLLNCHQSEVGWRAAMKRKSDRLPGQNSIERLITEITGLDKTDPFFSLKLELFLNQYPQVGVPNDFNKRLVQAFKFPYPSKMPKEPIVLEPPKKEKGWFRKIVSVVKAVLMVGKRGNTGVGVIGWSLLLGGLISFGSPVGLPLILTGAAIGILSGLSSYFYRKFVEKPHKKNVDGIDANLKYHRTRYELLYKLHHIKDKTYKESPLVYPKHCYAGPEFSPKNDDEATETSRLLPEESDFEKYVPESVRRRMALHGILQTILGFGTGMVIGISISSVVGLSACITLPVIGTVLAINAFGAILGPLIGAQVATQFRKASLKSSRDEIAQIIRIEKRKINLTANLGTGVIEGLSKTPQALLFELLQHYNSYSKQLLSKKFTPDNRDDIENLITKKEKTLRFIENATGLKRSKIPGQLTNNEDPEFYQHLVLYLLKDQKIKDQHNSAHQLVTAFKGYITGQPQTLIETTGKTLEKGTTLTDVNRKFLKNWAPFLAALTIAVPLGIMLFGSFAFVPLLLVGATIMGLYAGSRLLESKQNQNLEHYKETELKLNLIERSKQLQNEVEQVNKESITAGVVGEHSSQKDQLATNKVSPLAVVSQNKNDGKSQNIAENPVKKASPDVQKPPKSPVGTRSTYVGPFRKHAAHTAKGTMSSLFKESSRQPSEEIDENKLLEKAPTRLRHVPSTRDFLDLLQKKSQQVSSLKIPRSQSQLPLREAPPVAITVP